MSRLRKVKIINGVFWVEAPDEGVYVLCGCPADAVKHLMRRGLIVELEENGVTYESGPNAILLSDLTLQGGLFSNLSEFPVLQMLYRQGMILPDHPRNTGEHPIIMGTPDQVSAQIQYIYRGNYGLISEDEIMASGVPAEDARKMMQMKLKFAFGKIADPKELLDTRIVGGEATEIRNGVTVRRIDVNVYEFASNGDTVTVDMNLKPDETYESAYPLGFHHVKREYFAVLHSGEGDGWDTERPTMSSVLMFDGNIYLIDAGPNLDYVLNALGIGVNEIEGVFHTHSHDDHFAGITTLMRADHRLKYFATPLVRHAVTKKLAALMSMEEEDFESYFEVVDLEMGEWNDIFGLDVKPMFSPHPVETTIFMFRAFGENGYRTYAHYADIASFRVLEGMVRENAGKPGITRSMLDKVREDYLAPAVVKKIDIGGGLIHGEAEDFKDDQSEKIILAHTSRTLTPREKEIGAGAPFGTIDRLIPSYQDYEWRVAAHFLRAYYPHLPKDRIQPLLNNPVDMHNPESMLIREGDVADVTHLILTGNVELIEANSQTIHKASAGAFVGEMSALYELPSTVTARATSFVQTLKMPSWLYREFVTKNGLLKEITLIQEKRDFLQGTWLFGEEISYPVQMKIAKAVQSYHFDKGEMMEDLPAQALFLVRFGCIAGIGPSGGEETLAVGDFLGEEVVLFDDRPPQGWTAIETSELFAVPRAVLADIPVVRWKLLEAYDRRRSTFSLAAE